MTSIAGISSATGKSLLVDHKVAIGMTHNGDPYENALAERWKAN